MTTFKTWLAIALFCLGLGVKETTAQCDTDVGCIDCFDHCSLLSHMCDGGVVKGFCRKTCKSCPTESEVCNDLNCDHLCDTIQNAERAKCSCFDGYELDADGRTCNDVNECRNETICENENSPICVNTPGDYVCTKCSALKGVWQYYGKNTCCKRHARTFRQCGYSSTNGRIVRGIFSRVARWPWTAYIKIGNQLCGGSLLDREWVLTAAHCVNSVTVGNIRVVMGVLNATESGNIHEQTFEVSQKVIHPRFSMPDNDIALLRLSRRARFSRYVGAICLPNGHEPQEGETCYATGYGTTSFRGPLAGALQEVDLPIVQNSLCEAAYANTSNRVNSDIHMCAGYQTGGKDACQGDSGGPLVCQRCDSCDWYVAGITSFGRGCGRPGYYGVYTRVKYFEEWISEVTDQEVEQSTCKRPEWHPWGPWTDCSAECGGGTRRRIRSCLYGEAGEPDCIGETSEDEQCNTHICSRCLEWSAWAPSACTVTCGGGKMRITRHRRCESEDNDGDDDDGDDDDDDDDDDIEERTFGSCNMFVCPVWENWSSWGSCSATCGTGQKTATRTCNTFGIPVLVCDGENTRSEFCHEEDCLLRWTTWGDCSRTCGDGTQTRTRGDEVEEQECSLVNCPSWNSWQQGSCSATCGTGVRISQRTCNPYGIPNATCSEGNPVLVEECENEEPCRRRWSNFTSWSSCDQTCGLAQQVRTRTCLPGKPSDAPCLGRFRELRNCHIPIGCPEWGPFTSNEKCSVSCGGGTQRYSRECHNGDPGDIGCHEGSTTSVEICNTKICPTWGPFSPVGDCSVTCGGGTQIYSRLCNNGDPGDIGCHEGSTTSVEICNTKICPTWGPFSPVGDCSVTCGGGTQIYSRLCNNGDPGDIGCHEGSTTSVEICNTKICPTWGPFSPVGDCSVTCGGGTQIYSRLCNNGDPGDIGCHEGSTTSVEICNTKICPTWGPFSPVGDCSVTCGGGTQIYSRLCNNGDPGDIGCHEGSTTSVEICNTKICPTWGPFSPVGDCSVTCGGGTQIYSRLCNNGDPGDIGCHEGSTTSVEICNTKPCPFWSPFTSLGNCSVPCGEGTQSYQRMCINGEVGEEGCVGNQFETRTCNNFTCPAEWGPWSEFTQCSAYCGGGTQERNRTCIGGEPGTNNCIGDQIQSQICNTEGGSPCCQLRDVFNISTCQQFVGFGWCFTFHEYMERNCHLACCEDDHGPVRIAETRPSASPIAPICRDEVIACSFFYCSTPHHRLHCRATCGLC